jgi:hypothetical protein
VLHHSLSSDCQSECVIDRHLHLQAAI